MPIAITNTLVNGNVVDAPQLNTNFQDLAQPLNGTEDMDIIIAHTDAVEAPLTVNQKGAGPIAILMQNSVEKIEFKNDGTMEFANTAVNVGMNADRVDSIEGANIAKLDTHRSRFSIPFFIADPNAAALNSWDLPLVLNPTNVVGGTARLERVQVIWTSGSRTAGQSVTFSVIADAVNIGSVTLDNTNNAAFTIYETDFADDATFNSVTIHVTARTGAPTERNVTINVLGSQLLA